MGLQNDRGRWYFVKRVPKRFAHLDARVLVRVALHTDSQTVARTRAPETESALFAYWDALAAGRTDDALAQYQAARALAMARGFAYRPQAELATPAGLDDLLARLAALARPGGAVAPYAEAAALLGTVDRPRVPLSTLLAEYFDLTTDRLVGKSESQIHRWHLPRRRAVQNFVAVIGDKAIEEITRDDTLEFRRWWRDKIDAEGLNPHSANKDFQHLGDLFRTVCELKGLPLENQFKGLRFKEKAAEQFPFSVDWIRDRILAPGALAGMGAEARDVLLVMVNTGARPSEIIGARGEDFALADAVPHLRIRAHEGRGLKTDQSRRDLPLLGVSRDAAARLATAGGPVHYRDRNASWSATVNKYLGEHGLRETPDHSSYGLRHSFEDRLLEAGVDDRIRAELMGHKYGRPAYGKGGSLEIKQEAIARIAL
jgi:integrase